MSTTSQIWITWHIVLWYWNPYQKGNVAFGKLGNAATKRNNFDGKWWKGAAFAKQSNILFHRSCVATGCDVRILWPLTFDFWHAIASSESYSPVEEPDPTLANESAPRKDFCKNMFSNSASHFQAIRHKLQGHSCNIGNATNLVGNQIENSDLFVVDVYLI